MDNGTFVLAREVHREFVGDRIVMRRPESSIITYFLPSRQGYNV